MCKKLILTSLLAAGLAGIASAELVAWYPLDTDGSDASGNGHNGSVVGGTVNFGQAGANGATGSSAAFPNNGHIDVPYDSELNPASFTVTTWANAANTGGFGSPVTSRDDVGGGVSTHGYILYNDNAGNWNFWTGDGNPGWDLMSGGPVSVGTWTHIALTFDAGSGTKTIWINGAIAATQTAANQYSQNGTVESENLHIGSGQDNGANFFFSGNVDDVSVWSEVLTQSQIQSIRDNSVDVVPPVISVPKDIVINAPGPIAVPFVVTATDAIGPANPEVTCDPPSGSVFPIGTTEVECTAEDEFGNEAMATFNVTVLQIQDSPSERFLEQISLRGDFVPGAATGTSGGGFKGATFLSYQHAFLNNDDRILLEATLSGAGSNNVGLFTNTEGPLESIGIKGTASPSGPDYVGFKDPSLSDDGVAAFGARTASGDIHVTDNGTSTTLQVGSSPPGMADMPTVRALFQQAQGGAGQLFSPVSLTLGSGAPAVTAISDTLIWCSDTGTVAREGTQAQDLPGGVDYGHLANRVVSNDDDQIAFAGNLIGGGSANAAVWSGPSGALNVVARRGDPAPGTPGTFGQFAAEAISDSGSLAFRGTLNLGGTVNTTNNGCIWTNRSGGVQLIAREDAQAPCIGNPDVRFGRFDTMFINGDGQITFYAFLKGAAVNSSNDGSIWRSDPDGSMHLIAREGGDANNTDGSIYRALQAMSANNSGGVLFYALLTNGIGDTITANNFGAWLARGEAQSIPELIVRKGDTYAFAPKDDRTILGIGFDYTDNGVGGTGGYGRNLNDQGNTLLRLVLNGNLSGVFVLENEEEE